LQLQTLTPNGLVPVLMVVPSPEMNIFGVSPNIPILADTLTKACFKMLFKISAGF
jgi:hypothetical protein